MDYDEVYDAVKNACDDALKQEADDTEVPKGAFPITPFKAVDIYESPVDVIGVALVAGGFEFIVMKRDPADGDAIYLNLENQVWDAAEPSP
ncbi:hypothetical protein N5K21_20485 [Rhizobium pusense]|uniref:hypothetical protein n=1 Tax=Agrobacterium pusense TaxID=648995 RepID=UPI0024473927|nr:hypothetical protein [Agrobacterium pusense]MDH2091113.1 hypothetical protein [Agrobacterium pusense]